MESLSDELLGTVASFLSSVNDLEALSLTNRHLCTWVTSSKTADDIFRALYQYQFHGSAPCCRNHSLLSGRQLWRDTYRLCQSLSLGNRRRSDNTYSRQRREDDDEEEEGSDRRPLSRRRTSARSQRTLHSTAAAAAAAYTVAAHPLNTVQILPPEEEAEAILYDNNEYDDSDRQPCVGYFGLQPLESFPHRYQQRGGGHSTDEAGNDSTTMTPIAIWGDFPGLKIAPCWDALLNSHSSHRDQLKSIHDPKGSQVMDLKIHPNSQALANQGYTSPFFIAFASGVVMAVAAKAEDGRFTTISTSEGHSSEVTCMAMVPPSALRGSRNRGYLLSVCVSGDIYLYPNSLTQLNLAGRVCLNPSSVPKFPVFSMSASLLGPHQAVLCLGGQGLKVSLWRLTEKQQVGNDGCEVTSTHEFEYEPHVRFQDDHQDTDNEEEDQVDHNITHVSFVGRVEVGDACKKDLLVMGTSRGHVVTWDLLHQGRREEDGYTHDHHEPRLVIRTSHERVHNGGVESSERIRNMLLTVGGNDGVIKGLDLESGLPKANLLVHPGRLLAPRSASPVRLKCAVVRSWVCHERKSIIGFCRDGHVSEIGFQLHKLPSTSSATHVKSSQGDPENVTTASTTKKTKKKRRAIADGPTKGAKRQRRNSSQKRVGAGKTTVDSSNHQGGASVVPPSLEKAMASPEILTVEAQVTATASGSLGQNQKPEGTDCNDVPSMLVALPQESKDLFNQLAFCKWNKLQRPVLILSPLAVPEGPVRDAWLKDVKAYFKRYQGNKARLLPPCLVYWLGITDAKRAYSMISVSKLTPYADGVRKNYHQLPNRIRQRLDRGETLKRCEQQFVDALSQLPAEQAKLPETRSHLLAQFVGDYCQRKAAPL